MTKFSTAHINRAIQKVNGMKGPAEGRLLVRITNPSNNHPDLDLLVRPDEAIAIIKDNPRIVFNPVEKWDLR